MTLKLHELIALARKRGVSVGSIVREQRGIPELSREEAIAQYRQGEITEGRLSEVLGVDRLETRRIEQSTCCHCHIHPIEWADGYCQECWESHCEDEWQKQVVREGE